MKNSNIYIFFKPLTSRLWLTVLSISVLLPLAAFLTQPGITEIDTTDQLYEKQLSNLSAALNDFSLAVRQKKKTSQLKRRFHQSRRSFKQAAILIEYFQPIESRILNAPALNTVWEDNPETIREPHGFQVIEAMLFTKGTAIDLEALQQELALMQSAVSGLLRQPNRAFKLNPAAVLDACKNSVIRLTTLGITGYDSPLAFASLREADATLEGIEQLITTLSISYPQPSLPLLTQQIQAARNYLRKNAGFNNFNRLYFISQLAAPLYQQIIEWMKQSGLIPEEASGAVTMTTTALFSPKFINQAAFERGRAFRPNPKNIALGKALFFDPILSATKNRSCGSCHQPEKAFTDGLKTALAIDGNSFLLRNTPTLWYSALQGRQFMDSRASILEHQLNDVLHNQQEMQGSLSKSVIELTADANYRKLFREAYPDEKQPITAHTIANAISNYVRSLVSYTSRFDQYLAGNQKALTKNEIQGFNLFTGKAKCATCHFLPLFNGLVPPDYMESESEVLGVPKDSGTKPAVLDPDPGKFGFTRSVLHRYAFKTPTLRNIELTAPYMHNGVYASLEAVMDFYNNGGGAGLGIGPENQTLPNTPLGLSVAERNAVISFMRTLTDTNLLSQ